MKQLDYNYRRQFILRDAKIFQVKRFIKIIQRTWRAYVLSKKGKAALVIQAFIRSKILKKKATSFRAKIINLRKSIQARMIQRWYKLQKKLRIILKHKIKLQSKYSILKLVKIQSFVRGWLCRQAKYFHTYLGSLYKMRINERSL